MRTIIFGSLFLALITIDGFCDAKLIRDASVPANRDVGVGLLGGQPSAITAKYHYTENRAVDAGVGYLFNDFAVVYSDYLFHFAASQAISPYVGAGAVFFLPTTGSQADRSIVSFFDDRDVIGGVGIRLPVGAEWKPAKTKLGVFVEAAPGMGLYPRAFGLLQGGAGLRAYF